MSLIADRKAHEKFILAFGVVVLAFFLIAYLPLLRERREISGELRDTLVELEARGYGTSEESIMDNLRLVENELRLLRERMGPEAIILEGDPFIAERIDAPFQYFEFDRERNAIVSRLRALANEHETNLAESVIDALPEYVGQDREYLLWARLAMADQVLSGAILNGIDRIESLRWPRMRVVSGDNRELYEEMTVAIRVSGDMEALHPYLIFLVSNEEQVELAGLPAAYAGKRALFIDRFILRKESMEQPDRIVADLVIKGFLEIDG